MKKMIKHHPGRASEPEGQNAEELASLETPDDEGEWCRPRRNRITRWSRRVDPRPAFHYLAEDDECEQTSRGLNHLVSRNARGAQWIWKKVTVVVDSGAAENVMPRSMFPDRASGKQKGPRMERDSVSTPEGFVRKSTWQVADVRRPLVSASHIVQAGNDLFIGKDEAYILNRKKKEKSMFGKEGNVYVLDLFVMVPPSAVAPVTYTPMEVHAINEVAGGRE